MRLPLVATGLAIGLSLGLSASVAEPADKTRSNVSSVTPKTPETIARRRGGWDHNGPATSGSNGPNLDGATAGSPKDATIVARRRGGWDYNGPALSGSNGPELGGLRASPRG